ncbi:uncharacterized protein LOC119578916 [Penaeus monodon]|uniref:uncharacterized protein LOC119578916 n=1 Tax=Penaeus monodon TaxID=6687 RepID=UPI0018A7D67D|nr:uncharacterized protein LOC119578916 [Penaeus monodon]
MDLPSDIIYALIDKIKASEELWNTNHKNYKKKTVKRMKIVDISRELQRDYPHHAEKLTPDRCFMKFQYLRSHFQKQLRKIRNTSDGPGGKSTSKWEFFKACSFLLPVSACDTVPNSEMQQSSMVSSRPLKDLVWAGSLSDLIDDPVVMAPEEEKDPLQLATTYVETRLPAPTDSTSSTSDESSTPPPRNNSFIGPTPLKPSKMRKHRTSSISHTEEQLMKELANVHNEWKEVKELSAPMDPILESVKGFCEDFK